MMEWMIFSVLALILVALIVVDENMTKIVKLLEEDARRTRIRDGF